MERDEKSRLAAFKGTPWMDLLGRLVCDRPGLMRAVARLETRMLADRLEAISIDAPLWITGLARSGSTVLLELLAAHPAVTTQRYRDFPPIFTPYLWNRLLDFVPLKPEQPVERAHQDRILVTSESPEAFEEPLWMAFFPHLHDPHRPAVLGGTVEHPDFEAFLADHIRKLLQLRRRARYLAKANYNVTRLGYLLKLFPDARFVVPIRNPLWHIASLMKQHRLFSDAERLYPSARRHLARVGHFEFGLDRRPIHCGNQRAVDDILALWAAGREAEGWAVQWSEVYGFLSHHLETDSALRRATLIVRYEDLTQEPRQTLTRILNHCRLDASPELLRQAESRLRPPDYYRPQFRKPALDAIRARTAAVSTRFGYA
ncbi:MAG: sulfotransferase family protein [Pseudomonadota bacterium]